MLQNYPSIYVGLDVHNESLSVAISCLEYGREIRFYGNIHNQQQSINHLFLKIKNNTHQLWLVMKRGPADTISITDKPKNVLGGPVCTPAFANFWVFFVPCQRISAAVFVEAWLTAFTPLAMVLLSFHGYFAPYYPDRNVEEPG